MTRVTFNEQVVVVHLVIHGKHYLITKQPITSEDQITNRKSACQRKRMKMKALLHKARKAAATAA